MKSQKEIMLEDKLRQRIKDISERSCSQDIRPQEILDILLSDPEVKAIQDYANNVSISRMGFNDHGPVHMRIVCLNSLNLLNILHQSGIKTSLEEEGYGTFSDSLSAIILAAMLHDSGMTIGRKGHELYSGIISFGIISNILLKVYPGEENISRRTAIRSLAMEGILGHMGTNPIYSVEAGLILVSDGCDMTKGRARIPMENISKPTEGDIHKYSASSIEKVKITPGEEKPIRIIVMMKEAVGFFQVEEVLIPKIKASTIQKHIELYAGVIGEDLKRYL